MQYSLFTHGTALEVEDPGNLAGYIKVGWGTQITFPKPVPQQVGNLTVFPEVGPGSWFHLPLASPLTTFGIRNPHIASVTILFETIHCRITNVHVYDGVRAVQRFDSLNLHGSFLETRNAADINPDAIPADAQTYENTFVLTTPHNIFSAIGVTFFACAFAKDFDVNGQDPGNHFPDAVLTVSAAGAQFVVKELSLLQTVVSEVFVPLVFKP